jgi:DNA polymerase III subunit epsilon
VSGLVAVPAASLANRAAAYLEAGPAASAALLRDVLGAGHVPRRLEHRVARSLLADDPRFRRTPDGRWALAPEATRPSPALADCRFAVVDVETTGRHPGHGGRVMEIAVVEVWRGVVRPAFQSLVDPEVPVAPFAVALTGITPPLLRGAPTFASIADAVWDTLAGAVFVGHNERFDWMFLADELRRARGVVLQGPRVCTLRLSRRLVRGVDGRSLDSLTDHFGIENAARHRAGGDALATARLLVRLLGIAAERGAVTLGDLGKLRISDCGLRNHNSNAQSAIRNPQSAIE